jgi:hypothetical protein
MITLKKIDAVIQSFCLIAALVLIAFYDTSWMFISFFIIGGWQLLSVIVTRLFARNLPSVFHRGYYEKTLITLAVLGLIVLIVPYVGLFYFYGLLFIAPVLALWYIIITWHELILWQKRSLIHLK